MHLKTFTTMLLHLTLCSQHAHVGLTWVKHGLGGFQLDIGIWENGLRGNQVGLKWATAHFNLPVPITDILPVSSWATHAGPTRTCYLGSFPDNLCSTRTGTVLNQRHSMASSDQRNTQHARTFTAGLERLIFCVVCSCTFLKQAFLY